MTRFSLPTIAVLLAVVPVVGSEPNEQPLLTDLPSAEQMAARFSEGLERNLRLTDEQVPEVRAALVEMMQRQREILARQTQEEPSPAAMRNLLREIAAVQNDTKAALQSVLTEEQLAGFDDALLDQRAEAVGEGVARRLVEPLGLTPEQRDEIVPIFARHARARAEAVAEARKSGRRFGAFRAQREHATADQQELEQELSTVLTPEQLARYREIAAELRRARGRGRPTGNESP